MDYFWTVRAEFWDCFRIVRVEILGLFSDSPNRNFKTIFGQSRTMLRFDFDPKTDVFRFCDVFWYHNNSVTNRKGTKVPCFLWVLDLGHLWVIVRKINNMLLCDKWKLYVG